MKYPKISNYPSFDMLSGYQGQMAELDSIRVREMMQNQELNIDKIQFTPPPFRIYDPIYRDTS